MNSLIYNGHDTEPYMSSVDISDDRKEAIFGLMLQCIEAVEKQMPIGIYYKGQPKLITTHSVFLQKHTPDSTSEITKPSNVRTRMKFYKKGAQQAIGIDADQILSKSKDSRNGWKTLHLDKINDSRIMTLDEMWEVFQLKNNQINDNVHLIGGFATTPDFVRNWNYWFRIFLAQTPAQYDLKAIIK